MLKLLVVDDEPMMRRGLLEGFNWESMGVSMQGAVRNGLEAMEMIRLEQPDIVITDIKMPGMDGLKLTAQLKEEYPDIMVIILTGYSEFEYARSAVELQAAHYLLKPIEERQLFEIVDKIRSVINNRRKMIKTYEEASESLRLHRSILREHFLANALRGELDERELKETAPVYQVNLEATHYSVAKVELSRFKTGEAFDHLEYVQEKSHLMNSIAVCFEHADCFQMVPEGQYHWLILYGDDQSAAGRSSQIFKEILEDCLTNNNRSHIQVTIGISKHCQGVNQLHGCYLEAGEALAGKYRYGNGRVIAFDELVQGDDSVIPSIHKEELKVLLLSGNSQEVANYLRKYFQLLRGLSNVMVKSKYMVFDLFAAVADILQVHSSSDTSTIEFTILEKIESAETLEELEQEMTQFLLQSKSVIEKSRKDQSSRMVEKIIEYLNVNYMDDIDLNTMASHFSVHYSYLSRVFHMKMGTSLADYLHEIRMEKAKKLLAGTDITVYQIGQIIGYSNQKYFSRLFKKRIGCTPQQFRTSHNHKQKSN